MKVAIVINTSWNVYNYRRGLINAFLKEGWEVLAIAPPDSFSPKLVELGCRYIPMEMDNKGVNPFKDLGLLQRLSTVYRKEKPDCILHFTIKPNVYGTLAAKWNGIACISNVSGLGTVFIRKGFLVWVASALYKFAFQFPKRVFFQNGDDQALFVSLGILPLEKTDLVPGSGINLNEYSPTPLPVKKPFVFVLIARLLADKGIREYAEAVLSLKRKGYVFTAQLVGFFDKDGQYSISQEELDKWQLQDGITFLGSSNAIWEVIASAHCVVLPSYREGTPRSMLEAMALGRPIITTNVPGCKEVLVDGVNGFACEAKEMQSLSSAMEKMLLLSTDQLSKMGQEGRKLVERRFDENIVVRKYFEEILTK